MPRITKKRAQIKKMIKNRVNAPNIKEINNTKKINASTNKRRAQQRKILTGMLDGTDSRSNICSHFKIGATNFQKFLSEKLTMRDVHGFLQGSGKSSAKNIGMIGESASEMSLLSKNHQYETQVYAELDAFPFCATIDLKDMTRPEHVIIEVKTTESKIVVQSFKNIIPLAIKVQLWVQMECHGLDKAVLQVFEILSHPKLNLNKTETDNRNKNDVRGKIREVAYWNITKKVSLFPKEKFKLLSDTYTIFLLKYFHSTGVSWEYEDKEYLSNLIFNRAQDMRSMRKKNFVDNGRIVGEVCSNFGVVANEKKPPVKKKEAKDKSIFDMYFFQKGYSMVSDKNSQEKECVLDAEERDIIYASGEASRDDYYANRRLHHIKDDELSLDDV